MPVPLFNCSPTNKLFLSTVMKTVPVFLGLFGWMRIEEAAQRRPKRGYKRPAFPEVFYLTDPPLFKTSVLCCCFYFDQGYEFKYKHKTNKRSHRAETTDWQQIQLCCRHQKQTLPKMTVQRKARIISLNPCFLSFFASFPAFLLIPSVGGCKKKSMKRGVKRGCS